MGGALSKKKIDPAAVSTIHSGVSVDPTPTPGSGDTGPQAGVPGDSVSSSSPQGGPLVTVRVTTTLDPTASPRASQGSSSVLGGFSLSISR